ncbi:DEAD/DEAH box helicase [Cryobacterium sp. M15]|uniref:DEAD/DEAH box helicase n=1 Tax=Cryobacterium sp. M15 TaxID=2048291 RepID=UPI000CE44A04|nr:DEAD/DEAH box helicase [Cryobacterium sp. M15]
MAWVARAGEIWLDSSKTNAEMIFADVSLGSSSSIRQELPELRFSRRALRAVLRITGTFPGQLEWKILTDNDGVFGPYPLASDYVIDGKTVHRLNRVELDDIYRSLGGIETRLKGRLTGGGYLRLLSTPLAQHFLRDESDNNYGLDWAKTQAVLPVPPTLRATLYDYQIVGSSVLRLLADNGLGCLLADEMGLGKTIQVIALALSRPARSRTLVVAPASLIPNWLREFREFAPDLAVVDHSGPQRTGVASGLDEFDVVVTSYETVINDFGFIGALRWNIVVLDEAQQIRNPASQRAKYMKLLIRDVSVAVTGTPIENSLRDLWSLSEFVIPQLLGGLDEFELAFDNQQEAAQRLGRIAAQVTVRRRVVEVARDLPDRVEILTALQMDDEDRALMARVRNQSKDGLDQKQLEMICAHSSETFDDNFAKKPKVQHVLSLLAEGFAGGDKILVFASYLRSIDQLAATVRNLYPDAFVATVDGRKPVPDRMQIIDEFTETKRAACLILNPTAAGTGLNIVAANHVVHFNPQWNPAVTKQATARSYRRRQMKPVFVHHLYYADSVEERMVERSSWKQHLADAFDSGIKEKEGNENGTGV